MEKQSGSVTAMMLLVLLACVTGYVYYNSSGEADEAMEEFVELVVEKEVENLLDMPSGTLTGTLDFSAESKEK